MDKVLPQSNRIIMHKIHQRNLQTHYKKLFSIQKSRKRTNASLNISKYDLKGQLLQQQRNTEIDKNNVLLFQKLNKIMKRTDPLNQKNARQYKITSNKFAQHIHKINSQNQQFLQRLCASKPTIDNKKIFQQRQKQLNILKLLGRNPLQVSSQRQRKNVNDISENKSNRYQTQTKEPKNRNKIASMVQLSESFNLQLNPRPQYTQTQSDDQSIKYSQEYFKRQMKKIQQRKKKVKSSIQQINIQKTNRMKTQFSSQIRLKTKLNNLQPQKYSILFSTFKLINDCMYKVLILRKLKHYEFICAEVNNSLHQIYLQLQQSKANALFTSVDYDYQSIVDCLIINDHTLIINTDLLQIKDNMPSAIKMKKINKKSHSSITEQPYQHENTVFFGPAKRQEQNNPILATFGSQVLNKME